MEYIDIDTRESKYEIGNRVITRVSEEGANRIYEYDAKHIDSEAYDFSGVSREEMIEKLQILEDSMGSTTFWIKYQIMKSVGLNTYNRSKQ